MLFCTILFSLLAAFTTVASISQASSPKAQLLKTLTSTQNFLICPESLSPLKFEYTSLGPFLEDRYLYSPEYGTKYKQNPTSLIWDMTIRAEQDAKPFWQLNRREQIGSRFFQNPLISGIYERGYRQNFENAGFPGIDLEFADAQAFFLGDAQSSPEAIVVDLSCGSGFMTRKFIKSGKFASVVSVDLSPTMLAETSRRCSEEQLPKPLLIRADAARLPFPSNSIDYIHAGAAMHCWPRLPEALSEIYRVLKPGGRFYASTFFNSLPMVMSQRRGGSGAGGFYLFEDKQEVESFVRGGGFEECDVRKEGRGCAIVKAVKSGA